MDDILCIIPEPQWEVLSLTLSFSPSPPSLPPSSSHVFSALSHRFRFLPLSFLLFHQFFFVVPLFTFSVFTTLFRLFHCSNLFPCLPFRSFPSFPPFHICPPFPCPSVSMFHCVFYFFQFFVVPILFLLFRFSSCRLSLFLVSWLLKLFPLLIRIRIFQFVCSLHCTFFQYSRFSSFSTLSKFLFFLICLFPMCFLCLCFHLFAVFLSVFKCVLIFCSWVSNSVFL